VAIAFGDAGTAVATGEGLDLRRLPAGLGGRRSQVSLDHTLMETGGVGSEIHAAVFQKVTGHALKQMADVSDRIEPVIFRETLALPGLDDPGNLFSQFASEQGSRLRRSCRQCWRME
jgi:uncharacterized protein YjlB